MVTSVIVRLSEQRRVQRQLQQAHTFLHWHQRVQMLRAHMRRIIGLRQRQASLRSVHLCCPVLLFPNQMLCPRLRPPPSLSLFVSRYFSFHLSHNHSTMHQGMENMGRMDQCDIITMLAGSQSCAPPPLRSFSESQRGRAAEVAAWSLTVVGTSPPLPQPCVLIASARHDLIAHLM